MKRSIVRVSISHDRMREATKELTRLAHREPYRQGTSPELLWEWTSPSHFEDAQSFIVSATHTPGVTRIEGPEVSAY